MFRPDIVVQTKMAYTKVFCPNSPAPAGIHMLTIEPRAVFDRNSIVWVGLTPADYERMGINNQEFIRYLKDQKGQTKYYQDCILDFNAEVKRLQGLEESD